MQCTRLERLSQKQNRLKELKELSDTTSESMKKNFKWEKEFSTKETIAIVGEVLVKLLGKMERFYSFGMVASW